jgi:hypothetical protein
MLMTGGLVIIGKLVDHRRFGYEVVLTVLTWDDYDT